MLIYIGTAVTPRRRAAIITMKSFGYSSRNIAAQTNVPKSTVNNIYRHALQNAARKRLEDCASTSACGPETQAGPVRSATSTGTQLQLPALPEPKPVQASALLPLAQAVPLRELFSKNCLDTNARSGRPPALTRGQKKILVDTVRKDFGSSRMRVVDLQREAGVGHVCQTTALNALHANGLKAY